MFKSVVVEAIALLLLSEKAAAFAPRQPLSVRTTAGITFEPFFASLQEPPTAEEKSEAKKEDAPTPDSNADGLPWWWELVWKLDIMKTGEPGKEIIFGDTANVLRTNIEQIYGGYPSLDGCPLAEGEITDIADGTMFIGLQRYQNNYGSPYKLCFGPKSFLVVSDPVQARHILRDANTNYDKGVLAEILEPIMGKGLIPADPETWSVRRRQIVPAFHKVSMKREAAVIDLNPVSLIVSCPSLIEMARVYGWSFWLLQRTLGNLLERDCGSRWCGGHGGKILQCGIGYYRALCLQL
jgi:Cytochrome P450